MPIIKQASVFKRGTESWHCRTKCLTIGDLRLRDNGQAQLVAIFLRWETQITGSKKERKLTACLSTLFNGNRKSIKWFCIHDNHCKISKQSREEGKMISYLWMINKCLFKQIMINYPSWFSGPTCKVRNNYVIRFTGLRSSTYTLKKKKGWKLIYNYPNCLCL